MFDDELKYCPVCHDEYRAEISLCATCDVTLIRGAQMQTKSDSLSKNAKKPAVILESDRLIPLTRGRLLDLKRVKNVLAAIGIPSVLVNDDEYRNGCCGGPELMLQIRWQDQQKAEAALQQEHELTTGQQAYSGGVATIFDPQDEEVTCPACGHEFNPSGSKCPDCGLCFL